AAHLVMLQDGPAQDPLASQSLATEKTFLRVPLCKRYFGKLQNLEPALKNPRGRHLALGKSECARLEEGVPLGRSVIDTLTAKQEDMLPVQELELRNLLRKLEVRLDAVSGRASYRKIGCRTRLRSVVEVGPNPL